jgi:hypothetical protein
MKELEKRVESLEKKDREKWPTLYFALTDEDEVYTYEGKTFTRKEARRYAKEHHAKAIFGTPAPRIVWVKAEWDGDTVRPVYDDGPDPHITWGRENGE